MAPSSYLCLFFLVVISHAPRGTIGWPEFQDELKAFFEGFEGSYVDFQTPMNASEPVNVTAFVPSDVDGTYDLWAEYRATIHASIGESLDPIASAPERVNTADSIVALHETAVAAQDDYLAYVNAVVDAVPGTMASFGPDNAFLVKRLDSLQRKVWQQMTVMNITEAEAVADIIDSIRGTIITHDPDCYGRILDAMKSNLPRTSNIVFRDYYGDREYASGYVGVHGVVAFDLGSSDNNGTENIILSELQVHLFSVMDGTMDSPKEYSHPIYEVLRQIPIPVPESVERDLNAASRLMFLFGMEKALSEYPADGECTATQVAGSSPTEAPTTFNPTTSGASQSLGVLFAACSGSALLLASLFV